MDSFLKTVAALNDPTRLLILGFLNLRGEACVCELEDSLGMIQSRLSRHLKILKEAGFLEVRRQGTWAYYRSEPSTGFHTELVERVMMLGIEIPERAGVCAEIPRS